MRWVYPGVSSELDVPIKPPAEGAQEAQSDAPHNLTDSFPQSSLALSSP